MVNFQARANRAFSGWLSPQRVLWFKRLRRREHDWQRIITQRPAKFTKTSSRGTAISKDAIVSKGFDLIKTTESNLSTIRGLLEADQIDFVELARREVLTQPYLVVSAKDATKVLDALSGLPIAFEWNVNVVDLSGRHLEIHRAKTRADRLDLVKVERKLWSKSLIPLPTQISAVTIEFWDRLDGETDRVDGGAHSAGTLHRRGAGPRHQVDYLDSKSWVLATRSNRKVTSPVPHLYEITEPVDMVYTWVDGLDPIWQHQKSKALGRFNSQEANETAISDSRFKSRDELKYSLRSVEAFANWVNHIYIVTDQQVPDWLDTSNPKITVVDHTEIFKSPGSLPVFNSHAIESQLHRIPGLSEQYLYINDDIFFCAPTGPETFFTSNGLSKFFPSAAPLDLSPPSSRDMPVLSAAKNGRSFVASEHSRLVTNKFQHTPHPQLKSVLENMESDYPELFADVAASKFRHPNDYSIPSALYHFHAYAIRRAIIGNIGYEYLDIGSPDAELALDWLLHGGQPQVLCLNDTDLAEKDQARVTRLLESFLDQKFPVPSSFEY